MARGERARHADPGVEDEVFVRVERVGVDQRDADVFALMTARAEREVVVAELDRQVVDEARGDRVGPWVADEDQAVGLDLVFREVSIGADGDLDV